MRFILCSIYFILMHTKPHYVYLLLLFLCGRPNVTFPFNIWYKLVYFWFELTVLVLVLPLLVLTTSLVSCTSVHALLSQHLPKPRRLDDSQTRLPCIAHSTRVSNYVLAGSKSYHIVTDYRFPGSCRQCIASTD